MIFYESPYRLTKTLKQFGEYFGINRIVSVSRELTKIYEETVNGRIETVLAHFEAKDVKGEIVIILGGKEQFMKDDVE
jgi:16S rRNA (cytidine1402-2'-O)-methyltransferase